MDRSDLKKFTDILNASLDVYGKERSDTAAALWWKLLVPFSLDDVEAALADHLRSNRFAPTPADIITALSSRDGRPTADEAWAMMPRSEQESVCWTDEMARAFGVASPLLEAGDQVAARRAFIDRYEFEVSAARRAGTPVKAWMSWGFDSTGRAPALAKAVELGLMKPAIAQKFLPQLPPAEVEANNVLLSLAADEMLKRLN
jgi:hypothetical protein